MCVTLYLIGEVLALAVGELWLHEGVVEECGHVVLSGKKRVPKHHSVVKRLSSLLVSEINYDV